MAVELVVLGRLPVPADAHEPFEFTLSCADGSAEVYERREPEVRAWVDTCFPQFRGQVASIVFIRKAWDNAEAAAEALAECLNGVVADDATTEVHFDAASQSAPARTASDREAVIVRMSDAFSNPEPYFARWKLLEAEAHGARTDAPGSPEDDLSDA